MGGSPELSRPSGGIQCTSAVLLDESMLRMMSSGHSPSINAGGVLSEYKNIGLDGVVKALQRFHFAKSMLELRFHFAKSMLELRLWASLAYIN